MPQEYRILCKWQAITDHGGPSLNSHFNLFHLRWWTLTYFVFGFPQHRDRALELVQRGGGLEIGKREFALRCNPSSGTDSFTKA